MFYDREGKSFTAWHELNLNVIKANFRLLIFGVSITSSTRKFYFVLVFLSKFDILVESCLYVCKERWSNSTPEVDAAAVVCLVTGA
jgi:hypothetical protein